jgi:xanthine/CO dehydrogenase XdhC/CoxF family maturation factor
MKELNDIILAYDKAVIGNRKTALATVVHVEGSSYRRPGARMLVTEDGEITGAISGGCLEGDALRKAQFAIFQQKNKIEIYDTTDEDDLKFGVQLGCNGIVYILFEPIRNDDVNNPINLLKKVSGERKNAVLVTLFNLNKNAYQKGTCGLVMEDDTMFNDEIKTFISECNHVLSKKSSEIKHYENESSALFQFIPPAVQLIIIGAGNDAQPLMEMASLLGWKIVVVDGRATHATQDRFAKADAVVVSKSKDILSQLDIDERTAVILMTHNYNYDVVALEQLVSTNCNYTGALGPKEKLHRMLDELKNKRVEIDENKMQHIYGPVGLDIGAETSEEIAVSVVAEIKAVFEKRDGASLKERKTEIHKRSLIPHNE